MEGQIVYFCWCLFVGLFLVAGLGGCVDVDTFVWHQLTFRPSVLLFLHCGASILGKTSYMSCLCVIRTDCVQFCSCGTTNNQRTNSCNVEHVHECSWMLKFYNTFG